MVSVNITYLVFLIQLDVSTKNKMIQTLNETITGLNSSSICNK